MRPPNQLIPILAGERDSLAVSQLYPNLFPFLETSREKVGAAIRYDSIIFHNNNNNGNESRRSRRNSASTTRSSVEPRPRVRRATLQSHAAPPDAGGPGCLALRRPTRRSPPSPAAAGCPARTPSPEARLSPPQPRPRSPPPTSASCCPSLSASAQTPPPGPTGADPAGQPSIPHGRPH